jgi:uncharacterized damage-inducible protein DinB
MKQFLKELLEYSHDINQKLRDIFTENPGELSEKAIKLYNHILNAHHIWNNRISHKQEAFSVWEIHPAKDYKIINKINLEHSLQILEKFDLNDKINYTNTKGQVFTNSVRDIVFHVINHSTYHRGQIATELKQIGIEPINADFISYKRQK